jgi:hypothetical protein
MVIRDLGGLLKSWIRPGAGVLILAAGAFVQHRSGVSVEGFAVGVMCYVVGAVILAPLIGQILAAPMGSLFMPSDRFERPVPIYSRPQARRKEGHFEEAMEEFRRLVEEHPDQVDAYVEMIDITIVDLHDGARARAIYERGMASLQHAEHRASLERMYNAIRSRLAAEPAAPAPRARIRPGGPAPDDPPSPANDAPVR